VYGFSDYELTNELRTLREITDMVRVDGVAEWFAEARRCLPPGTRLAINENAILNNGGATSANQENYLHWIRELRERGQAPDVVGFQGHFGGALTPPERVWDILDRFAAEVPELQITEFDINTLDLEAQADYTRDFLTAAFAHPAVSGVTLWGYWAGDQWQPGAALYREDWSPKPNAESLTRLLDSWRTRASAITDAEGSCSLRAYRGSLRVTVSSGGVSQTRQVQLTTEACELRIEL
jgi:endo-1,4-beta-xylanase